MNNKIRVIIVTLSLSCFGPVEASPFSRFTQSCRDLVAKVWGGEQKGFKGLEYTPPEDAHASHLEVLKELEQIVGSTKNYPHLPYLSQSIQKFKNTNEAYIQYFMEDGAWKKPGYKKFLEDTLEILYFPHSSVHGHVRLRIGNKMYGFENVQRTMAGAFDPTRIFKQERKLKRGKKAGNMGVVFVLTEEQKLVLKEKMPEIEKFYQSSERYNLPPFDGKGELEVKVLVDEETGKIKYHSPAPPSAYGNRRAVQATLEEIEGEKYLVAPNGMRQIVFENDKGELVTRSYSCASSACRVMNNFLGLNVKDMPYAGSFMTHLKNGAEGHLKPDAIIHYYPESDL